MINTSPEPFTNWIASVTEDLGVIGGLLLALKHPAVFLVALALFFLLLIWLLPKLWHGHPAGLRSIAPAFFARSAGGGRRAASLPSPRRAAHRCAPDRAGRQRGAGRPVARPSGAGV